MAFSYKNYAESEKVKQYKNELDTHNQNKVSDWTGGTYGQGMNDALNRVLNRDKFSYDLNSDAIYNQYKNQYINLGKLAMQDTMGQAAALTGGYGNSYAATVGNQAYQGYLQMDPDSAEYSEAYPIYTKWRLTSTLWRAKTLRISTVCLPISITPSTASIEIWLLIGIIRGITLPGCITTKEPTITVCIPTIETSPIPTTGTTYKWNIRRKETLLPTSNGRNSMKLRFVLLPAAAVAAAQNR